MDDFDLIETIGGKWVKVERGFHKATFTMEMKEILLSIDVSNDNITFGTKNGNDIYEYLGDITFEVKDNSLSTHIFSSSISNISFNRGEKVIDNFITALTSLDINYTNENRDKWHELRDIGN